MRNDWRLFLRGLAMMAALSGTAGTAQAALGGGMDTVEADEAHFSASVFSTTTGTATCYVLTLPNGGTIKEYIGDGVVFALSWQMPGRPDLVQLLGSRFAMFQAGFLPPGRGMRRAPPTMDRADFVIHSRGHPGAFRGEAYLPTLVPAGFSLSDLN